MPSTESNLKKRIAIIVHGGIGGGLGDQGQPAIMHLTEELSTRFNVHVFSHSSPGLAFRPTGYNFFSAPQNVNRLLKWMLIVKAVYTAHRKERFHAIYAFWGYPAGVVAYMISKFLGLPVVVHLQGGDSVGLYLPELNYGVFSNRFRSGICRYVYQRVAALVALSEFQVQSLNNLRVTREIDIVPFAVKEKLFPYQPRLENRSLVFLMVGNLTPIKNQKFALETFKEITKEKQARLVIIGSDYFDGQLQKLVTNLSIGKFVDFVGPQLHTDIGQFYRDADVLLHTSFYEGQGLVFAEAASCGALLAGTRVGMLADMGDACGIIAVSQDPKQFSHQVLSVIDDQGHASRLRANAKAWVNKFDQIHMVSSISKIIDRIT